MKGGKREPTEWNLFVTKIFNEGREKNSDYSFKQALSDASERKGEMNKSASAAGVQSKTSKKSIKKTKKGGRKGKKGTRRRQKNIKFNK